MRSGSSERLIRSLRLDLMSVARRWKKPMTGFSTSGSGLNHGAQDRYVLAQRDVDVGQHGFELVQIQALELERGGQHDLVVLEPECRVQERAGVQLEQLLVDGRRRDVIFGGGADGYL